MTDPSSIVQKPLHDQRETPSGHACVRCGVLFGHDRNGDVVARVIIHADAVYVFEADPNRCYSLAGGLLDEVSEIPECVEAFNALCDWEWQWPPQHTTE